MEGNRTLPKISIITIFYNSEKTIEETIKSVVSQNYENLEYIIIDGGSKDGTLDIVKKYENRIATIISEPDEGISDAFNKGIKYSTGEIIGIINSDDVLLPNALRSIADNYRHDIDVYSGNLLFWDCKTDDTFVSYPELKFDKLKLQYGVAHPSRFIRKDAYQKYGCYVKELRYNMDIELLCRFYKNGVSFLYVDKCLAKFRLGGTTNDNIYKKKADYQYFVKSFGGSSWDFKILWTKAIIKYNLIQIGYKLFGDDLKFKISRSTFLSSIFYGKTPKYTTKNNE